MDCKGFRKEHLAYLDDTLPGELMREAQQHVMACNACAAHDTLVRRSLMIARSMPTIEPSAEFQARLRTRLAACRNEPVSPPRSAWSLRSPRAFAAVAAGTVLGTLVWRGLTSVPTSQLSMQPVIATKPAVPQQNPYMSAALMQAMSTGNPVWPVAVIIEDAPTHFAAPGFSNVSDQR